jgi:hypothetical protein
MNLTRTRDDGPVIVYSNVSIRDAGKFVAWCAADNLGWSQRRATDEGVKAERAFTAGEPYVLGRYTFVIS